jgi:hypothetical protein
VKESWGYSGCASKGGAEASTVLASNDAQPLRKSANPGAQGGFWPASETTQSQTTTSRRIRNGSRSKNPSCLFAAPRDPAPRVTVPLMRNGTGSMVRALALSALLSSTALPIACSPGESSCHGDTSPCELLDESECASASLGACAWGASCSAACLGGEPSECQSDGPPGPCYLAYSQQCVPRAGNQCGALGEADCVSDAACHWGNVCHGQLQCSSLLSEAECNRRVQCSWQMNAL